MTPEERESLLQEARDRYPIGTVFYAAHLSGETPDYECVVDEELQTEGAYIGVGWLTGDKKECGKKNPQGWMSVLYARGKWAKIVRYTIPKLTIINNYLIY